MSQTEEEHIERLTDKRVKNVISTDVSKSIINYWEDQRLMQLNEGMNELEEVPSDQVYQTCQPKSLLVHALIMIFGTSAWIGVNGIFIQLPLLVNSSSEGWKLAAYLVVAVQIGNIAPVIYGLSRKSPYSLAESHCIYGMLIVASVVMILISFFYNKTSTIGNQRYSIALIILAFFTAAVSCTSSVLFMPYLSNFKDIYLVSYFIGEGLSGVIPSIVALIQGIDESPKCNNTINSSEVLEVSLARFSSQDYFLFLFSCHILSLVAFFFLENLSYIEEERINLESVDSFSIREGDSCSCQKQITVLLEDLTAENDSTNKHTCTDDCQKTEVGRKENRRSRRKDASYTKSKELNLGSLYLYILLSLICLLANGFLPSLQPYSCLSYGNIIYHLSATFSQIANPVACLLALWFLPLNKITINVASSIIFVISGYVIYLAAVSPNPPLKGSKLGKALVVLSWILLIGLISYVKLMITSVFRRKSEKTLFSVGIAMQAGSACGAIMSFVLINFTNLLKEYKPCDETSN